jgi:hypothetical protein
MRLHPLILFLLMANWEGYGQVLFDLPSAIPPLGTQPRELWYSSQDTSIVTSGLGVDWELNNLVFEDDLVKLFSEPSTTPYAPDFPSATHAVGEVFLGASDTAWQYFTLSGDSLFHLGGSWTPPPDLLICSDPIITAVFPFSYGDQIEEYATCAVTGGSPSFFLEGREPVATGTIHYPGGTIPDVALVRRYWGGAPLDEYLWYSTGDILAPVGQFAYGTLTITAPLQTGLSDGLSTTLVQPFPNPANEEVFIEIPINVPDGYVYQLTDLMGRIEQQGALNITGTVAKLDVAGLPSGHYLFRASSPGSMFQAQVSIMH